MPTAASVLAFQRTYTFTMAVSPGSALGAGTVVSGRCDDTDPTILTLFVVHHTYIIFVAVFDVFFAGGVPGVVFVFAGGVRGVVFVFASSVRGVAFVFAGGVRGVFAGGGFVFASGVCGVSAGDFVFAFVGGVAAAVFAVVGVAATVFAVVGVAAAVFAIVGGVAAAVFAGGGAVFAVVCVTTGAVFAVVCVTSGGAVFAVVCVTTGAVFAVVCVTSGGAVFAVVCVTSGACGVFISVVAVAIATAIDGHIIITSDMLTVALGSEGSFGALAIIGIDGVSAYFFGFQHATSAVLALIAVFRTAADSGGAVCILGVASGPKGSLGTQTVAVHADSAVAALLVVRTNYCHGDDCWSVTVVMLILLLLLQMANNVMIERLMMMIPY